MAPSLVVPDEKSGPIISDDHDDDVELVYGFPDESVTNFSRARFPSKIGGKPVFLLDEAFETPRCSACASKLRFLLQIYAPVSENPAAFHRTLYIYVCTNSSSCTLKPGADSVVVIRAQLPRRNSVYPYNFGEGKVKDFEGDGSFVCALCGGKATERCGGCASVQYCSRDCQKEDWNLGHKYVCKKTGDCEDAQEKLQENRKRWLFREISLETAVCSDDEDEEWSDEESESEEEDELPVSEVLDNKRIDRVEDGQRNTTERGEEGEAQRCTLPPFKTPIPSNRWTAGRGSATYAAKEPATTDGVAPDCGGKSHSKKQGCEEGANEISSTKGKLGGLATMQDASAEELPESLFKSRFRADATFDRFTRITSYPPDQVVRYQRGGNVLWMHSDGQYQCSPGEKRCSLCGGALTFEMQVLPQLLYYITENIGPKPDKIAETDKQLRQMFLYDPKPDKDTGERASIGVVAKHLRDGLDWGVIAIWTCTTSCAPLTTNNQPQYVRESHVWLQPAPSAHVSESAER